MSEIIKHRQQTYSESKKSFWRGAILCIEDYMNDGRIFRSLDEPLSAFLHSESLEEKNSSFIITLTTLLGNRRSNDLSISKIVSSVGSRVQWVLENDDEAKNYFSDVVANSIYLRNDTSHGRFPDPEGLHEITKMQHDVLMRIYVTIILHGGVPTKDLIYRKLNNDEMDFRTEWEDPISDQVIDNEIYRWR